MRLRMLMSLVAAVALALPAVFFAASPAAAAPLPNCDSVRRYAGVLPGFYVDLPARNGSVNCVLGQGNTGPAVRVLQTALVFCNNGDTGGVDGVYGAKTRNVITWIQAANGLTADGVYGPQTRKVLRWVHHNGQQGICYRSPV
ncbi:peptidoglycan-binding domain-containing protein [Asanoa sp. WMMD1127]|uniref:peptidoglycan-binding domain-containing protein n=1 Tax=Asanoa sp. WMMD1127 TaxID=3016107 RepID=UPI0024174E7E|nr:peptidoglycan-binding domain-containing protein [Asanoa sp. WMMD1127]MDG4821756.1 peptidoglycan-binding domain-containing protein [Asanoa sp. WMMD1127]